MTSPVDKFLADAVSAARDHAADDVDDGAATRLRLRESLAPTGASRRKRFTLIAAVIGSLFGSTAFAYWAGWRPPWSAPAETSTSEPESTDHVSMRLPESERGGRARTPSAIEAAVDADIAAISDAGLEAIPDAGLTVAQSASGDPSASTVGAPTTNDGAKGPVPFRDRPTAISGTSTSKGTGPFRDRASRERTTPRIASDEPRVSDTPRSEPSPTSEPSPMSEPSPTSAPPTSAPPTTTRAKPDPELAAYRHAHELHFRGSDPKAALAAWDAYLATYPSGKLAPEARYDRALVLVKLARWADARAALAPFATATVGSYRQKEAAEILAAIRDRK